MNAINDAAAIRLTSDHVHVFSWRPKAPRVARQRKGKRVGRVGFPRLYNPTQQGRLCMLYNHGAHEMRVHNTRGNVVLILPGHGAQVRVPVVAGKAEGEHGQRKRGKVRV